MRRGADPVGSLGRLVVGGQVGGEPADRVAVVAPGAVEHLVGGAVEVDAVDRVVPTDAPSPCGAGGVAGSGAPAARARAAPGR